MVAANPMNPNYEVPVNFNNSNPSQKTWVDDFEAIWDTLTSPITTLYHDTKDGIAAVWSGVHESTISTIDAVGSLGNAVITGTESVITGTEDSVNDLAKTASTTVTAVAGDVQGIASSLSLPLLAAGGVALLILLRK